MRRISAIASWALPEMVPNALRAVFGSEVTAAPLWPEATALAAPSVTAPAPRKRLRCIAPGFMLLSLGCTAVPSPPKGVPCVAPVNVIVVNSMQYPHTCGTGSVNSFEQPAGDMRRPLMSAGSTVLFVVLAVGTAGCSSSSGTADGSGRDSRTASASASGSASGSGSSSAADGGGPQADGSQTGGALSADGSGTPGGGDSGGGNGNGDGNGSASSSPGVLFGADSLPSPAADHCRTKNLKAAARSTGQGRASVVITNKGAGSCTVSGFPSLLFVSEAGRTELPVDWDGSAADAAKLTLAPGDSASAALTFTGLDECDPITGLDIVPPGESRPLTPAFTNTGGKKQAVHICDTGVRVKAFSSGR